MILFTHVCHVWERFWPIDIGGLERYILWLSYYLSHKEGIDFSLLTGRTKILLLTRKIKKVEDTGFLQVYRLGPNPVDVLNGACMYTMGTTPQFLKKMKFKALYREAANWKTAQTADIFHIHGVWRDLEYINLGIYLSRRFQKPLVMTLHGGFIGDPFYGGMPLHHPVIKRMLQNDVAAITTYCKEVKMALDEMGLGEKSYYVTNFLDTPKFHNTSYPIPAHEVTLIYVGRMEPVQTPHLVIKAFKKVHDELPNTKLTIVGYGRLFDYLKALIKQLGLEDAVTMTGRQTDVRRYLWQSDIFVATNFGYIASLEAWSAGLTLVAPDFGILKELVEPETNGLLYESNNVDSLAATLIRVVKDKELRQKLAVNGALAAQQFDIRAVAPKMAKIYRSVLEK